MSSRYHQFGTGIAARAWIVARLTAGTEHAVIRLATPTTIRGRLLDPEGQPLAGYAIDVWIEGGLIDHTDFGAPSAETHTNARGEFKIDPIWGE